MNKKHIYKKLTAVILVLALLVGGLGFAAKDIGNVYAAEINTAQLLTKKDIAKYTDLVRSNPRFADKTAKYVKVLSDFSGYTYILIECEPCGYIIYDNQLTIALELNANGKSPYVDRFENLIYGGPTYYYIKSPNQNENGEILYQHTVLDEIIIADAETQGALKAHSMEISESVKGAVNEKNEIRANSNNAGAGTQSASFEWEVSVITNWQTIAALDTTGFNLNGNCGYISAAIIVYYYYKEKGYTGLVPSGSFDIYLVAAIQGNMPDTTFGVDVAARLTAWSSSHGAFLHATCQLLPSPLEIWTLMGLNRPVALGGYMPIPNNSPGFHSIVVHGASRNKTYILGFIPVYSDYYYWAHFGWYPNTNDTTIHESVLVSTAAVFY